MFMNEEIAKKYGEKVEQEALAGGATAARARLQGLLAAAAKLRKLNEWTKQNVGLN
jgi:hypothetical protein